MEEGRVPEDWKIENVTLIFKKGSNSLLEIFVEISMNNH